MRCLCQRTACRLPLALLPLIATLALPAGSQSKEPIKVGEIYIVGNSYTPDYLITSQLPFRPGETVSRVKVAHAARQLKRCVLWESAELTVLPEGKFQPGVDDVLIQIQETSWSKALFFAYELARYRLIGDLDSFAYVKRELHELFLAWSGRE
jgi:outer membrane protein assembly factor BamA